MICEELFAIGALTQFGAGSRGRVPPGVSSAPASGPDAPSGSAAAAHRDPWATLAVGDLAFIGDEVFVNVCRPVLIGREVFLTMRSMIVTHNIGHSVLEGFENRFAPVVLEDRAQIGLGTVVYAGCRIGAEAIVASNSYVVGDMPARAFAIGVPAKVTGSAEAHASRAAARSSSPARLIDDLHELLALRGHEVSAIADGDEHGFECARAFAWLFGPTFRGAAEPQRPCF